VTENASGSTSQAANTVEAIAEGSKLLLIDEDTSATNFMVRDQLMAQLVSDEQEPITPFVRCVRSIYEDMGISTVIVVGSSGAYLSVADTVIQLDNYQVKDVTEQAKKLAVTEVGEQRVQEGNYLKNLVPRTSVNKMKVHGWDTLSLDKTDIDLRYFEQLVGAEQTAGLGYCIQYILNRLADGKKNAVELTDIILEEIEKKGFVHVLSGSYLSGTPVLPRKHEISACLQRYRNI
jgi:predicted ABC-class ATPase